MTKGVATGVTKRGTKGAKVAATRMSNGETGGRKPAVTNAKAKAGADAGGGEAFDMAPMRAAAAQATALLRVLANEDRLLLLCQLSQGEKSVGELEALLGIRQPTLSQQLGVLRTDGLVNTRRDGKRIHYSVAQPNVLTLLNTLYAMYCPQDQGARDVG